jgi:hypothetical protein
MRGVRGRLSYGRDSEIIRAAAAAEIWIPNQAGL